MSCVLKGGNLRFEEKCFFAWKNLLLLIKKGIFSTKITKCLRLRTFTVHPAMILIIKKTLLGHVESILLLTMERGQVFFYCFCFKNIIETKCIAAV